jgi:hypothetical protein
VEGLFPSESGGAESDLSSNAANPGVNSYTLQINTNSFQAPSRFFPGTPPVPVNAVEQFVYDALGQTISIWFVVFGWPSGTCPSSSFQSVGGNCYLQSTTLSVPQVLPSDLVNVQMTALTTATKDTLLLHVDDVGGSSTFTGTVYALTVPSTLQLASGWNAASFNIYGDNGGTQASFTDTTSIEVTLLTTSSPATRAAPACATSGSDTVETNSLTLTGGVTRGCCAFGGDQPGIQFLESNGGATAPACPTLTATPSPVSIPEGGEGTTKFSVVGTPAYAPGDTAAVQPASCTVTGPVSATQLPAPSPLDPEFSFTGGTGIDTVVCDTGGPALKLPINASAAIFTVSPNPIEVVQGSCVDIKTKNSSPSAGSATVAASWSTTQPAGATLKPSGSSTAPAGKVSFQLCTDFSTPTGSYPGLEFTSTGSKPVDDNTTTATVDITPCPPIPKSEACTFAGYAACGKVSDGCGGTYDCPVCGTGMHCSTNVCCPEGDVFYDGLGCHAPCASGTIPCPAAGGCATAAACSAATNGSQSSGCGTGGTARGCQ